MWVPERLLDWLKRHADFDEASAGWKCKETGADIMEVTTGRSIWFDGFSGGAGEVRQVSHPYCPQCGSEPQIRYGQPICESELVKVGRAEPSKA